jgi:hypothetical protein
MLGMNSLNHPSGVAYFVIVWQPIRRLGVRVQTSGRHWPLELKPVERCVRAIELGQWCFAGAISGDQGPIRERSSGASVGDDDAHIRQPDDRPNSADRRPHPEPRAARDRGFGRPEGFVTTNWHLAPDGDLRNSGSEPAGNQDVCPAPSYLKPLAYFESEPEQER